MSSSTLLSARGQIYEGHLSVLRRLNKAAGKQDKVNEVVADSVSRVNKEHFLSVLEGLPRNDSHINEIDSESEAPIVTEGMSLGPQCYADTMVFVHYLNSTIPVEWALRMADATGKPSAGILSGRFLFLGDFDECRAVTAHYKSPVPGKPQREFRGQYCLGKYDINLPPIPAEGNYRWALCLPDSCTESDALEIGNMALKMYNVTQIHFESMLCNMRHVPWTPRAIGVVVMVAIIVSVVVVGTVLDILLIQLPKWKVTAEVREDLGENFDGLPSRGPYEAPTRGGDNVESEPLILNQDRAAAAVKAAQNKQSLAIRSLLAFSAWTNSEKLLSTKQPPGTLTCLNGLRVITINWVALGHTVLILSYVSDNLGAYVQTALKRWSFQVILNATFSVDTFFVMSSLLVTYMTLTHMRRSNGKFNWLMFYVHRYLRLTPVYMFTMGIYLATLPYMVDGPLFPQKTGYEQDPFCKNTWWGNPLYIQNLVKFEPAYCLGWAWYLAVDMQFYVLSPLLIIPLYYRPKLGYIITFIFFLVTTITPFALTEARYYSPGRMKVQGHSTPLGDENYDIYTAPYCRMGPYLVGILCGYALYRLNGRPVKINRVLLVTGWAAAAATALAIIYGLTGYYTNGTDINLHVSAIYKALSRTAWGVCIAWVIFCCVTGHGGVINTFLSWSAWVPFAKLTYSMYLVHCVVLFVWIATARVPFYADDMTVTLVYLATLLASYAVAFVVSILFEMPWAALEKTLLMSKKKR
ncbi:nose resistant to fluoxetine protein 6-like [Plakobranchus ocellatus]|uniref:Nose resistant to fluoxetine protein 6-like n=1 Tax=Plakobranchus ocellatus TaxID=259542 RepID=A0AAV4BE53_9GAST|nr:nose resistant to fluoxetine protein 6-like [Plakobranchus ocellatus]